MTCTSDNPPTFVRRTLHFTGRVQGVGFRFTAEAVASRYRVAGFVRNLPDGRVELVAEGSPAELDLLQSAVEQAMQSCIKEVSASDSTATGEFASFSIAF